MEMKEPYQNTDLGITKPVGKVMFTSQKAALRLKLLGDKDQLAKLTYCPI